MIKKVLHLEYLEKISREIASSSNVAEIEQKLAYVLEFYSLINYEFTYDSTLWRGVKCPSGDGFPNVGRVGYPPPIYAIAGRLNDPGKPILYVSINQFSVLEEIHAQEGDYVHVVAYAFNQGQKLRCGILGEITHTHRWGRAMLSDYLGKELNRIMKEMPFDAGKSYVYTDAFLSSILRDKLASQSEYIKQRTLSRLLFKKIDDLEAIVYPSVAHDGAMNFAISPEAADKKLNIKSTFVVYIKKKYDYGIYDFEIVKYAQGHNGDGTITWLPNT